ncbi:GL11256 [Drosophila persimilis]|uniref:GL11256 n=1 Tax=Drosophila persimilis TaxID=7234 RepID=B4GDN6_DROPE|nr:GL11256 [Drosophila persimilis]
MASVKTDEPQLQGNVVDAIDNMINGHEMQALIKRIARERVRCNFLLATYQLPDMNFALNTHIDTLRYQFRERLRQRNERNFIKCSANFSSYRTDYISPELTNDRQSH